MGPGTRRSSGGQLLHAKLFSPSPHSSSALAMVLQHLLSPKHILAVLPLSFLLCFPSSDILGTSSKLETPKRPLSLVWELTRFASVFQTLSDLQGKYYLSHKICVELSQLLGEENTCEKNKCVALLTSSFDHAHKPVLRPPMSPTRDKKGIGSQELLQNE